LTQINDVLVKVCVPLFYSEKQNLWKTKTINNNWRKKRKQNDAGEKRSLDQSIMISWSSTYMYMYIEKEERKGKKKKKDIYDCVVYTDHNTPSRDRKKMMYWQSAFFLFVVDENKEKEKKKVIEEIM
jgi:hypothetical protein